MKHIATLFLLVLGVHASVHSQEYTQVILPERDTMNYYISDGTSDTLHYLYRLPENQPKGALVIFPSGGERTTAVPDQIDLDELANEAGLAVFIPSYNWGTEAKRAEVDFLNSLFEEWITRYQIPADKFILGGLSNGGMVSFRYAEISVAHPELCRIQPAGLFGLDMPVDLISLYAYCDREIERNFSEAGMNEARWLKSNYERAFGGSPSSHRENYVQNSIFTHDEPQGGNAQYLKEMPLLVFTDLDVEWLINERHRDLYDWNGTNLVALVNSLKLMGNSNAHIEISMGKGIRPDGRRHPHSWSIMNGERCIQFCLQALQ